MLTVGTSAACRWRGLESQVLRESEASVMVYRFVREATSLSEGSSKIPVQSGSTDSWSAFVVDDRLEAWSLRSTRCLRTLRV